MTRMYGPAVRRKRVRRSGGIAVLHQCIRPLIGVLCSGPPWISARGRSHYRTGLTGPFGSPVFARAGKTDPPSRLILSQTSAGNRLWGYVIDRSLSSAVPLFVPCCRSFVPACVSPIASRARAVKAGRRVGLPHAAAFPGHALTAPSGRGSSGPDDCIVSFPRFEVATPWQAPPRRCGPACWRARSPARCGAIASWPLQSRS